MPRKRGSRDRKTSRTYVPTAIEVPEEQRSQLPTAPCFRCGARGECKHSGER